MPPLSELIAEEEKLLDRITSRVDPVARLATVRGQLAKFQLLRLRATAPAALMARALEEPPADSQRDVVIKLCEDWWGAVRREMADALGELPESAAVLAETLPPFPPSTPLADAVRGYLEPRLQVLADVLAS